MSNPPSLRLEMLNGILDRTSTADLIEPGPSADELEMILAAGLTAPDHGRLRPWRLVIVEGEAREHFASALEGAAAVAYPERSGPIGEDRIRAKAFAAPALIAVISAPRPAKVPVWEQVASAACTGFGLVLGAHALGLGAMWKSVPFQRGPLLDEIFGMSGDDALLGWVLVGTPRNSEDTGGRPPINSHGLTYRLTSDGVPVPFRSTPKNVPSTDHNPHPE